MCKQEEWQAFSDRGLHLIHLNNSVLPKIDELRDIAKRTKAAVIGISESKLDSTVLDPEICIENYEIFRFDRNRHGGVVTCHIRSNISYKLNSFLPNEIENITFDILMPHTKPITIGIIYRPPNQSRFINGKYIFDKSSSNNKNLDSFTGKVPWILHTFRFKTTDKMSDSCNMQQLFFYS